MNSIKRLLHVLLFTGVGLFGVVSLTFAFNNLSTQGGGSSTGGGSSVGSLQQVTDVGNTTDDPLLLTGNAAVLTLTGTAGLSTSTITGDVNVNGTVSSTQFFAAAGSAAAPSISFGGAEESDTGLYFTASNRFAASAGGTQKMEWLTTHIEVSDDVLPDGDDTRDNGSTGRSWKDLYVDGVGYIATASSTNFRGSAGAVGSPTFTFSNDTDSGMYQSAAGRVTLTANGLGYFEIAAGGVSIGRDTTPVVPYANGNADIGSASLMYDNIFAENLGSYATPFSTIHVSTTAASTHPAIAATGTVMFAGPTASATTTLNMVGPLCILGKDTGTLTQRFITLVAGVLTVSTTDCR